MQPKQLDGSQQTLKSKGYRLEGENAWRLISQQLCKLRSDKSDISTDVENDGIRELSAPGCHQDDFHTARFEVVIRILAVGIADVTNVRLVQCALGAKMFHSDRPKQLQLPNA